MDANIALPFVPLLDVWEAMPILQRTLPYNLPDCLGLELTDAAACWTRGGPLPARMTGMEWQGRRRAVPCGTNLCFVCRVW